MTNSIKSFCRSRLQIPYYTTCNFSMGYSRKKTGGRGLRFRTYFFENPPGIFLFFLLYPWKFQTKQSSTPWNSSKFLLDPLEIPGSKTKTLGPGNSTLFFRCYCTFVAPPYCYWWLIMKKRGWKLYRSPYTNPRVVRKCNSAIFSWSVAHPWKFHFVFN